MLNGKHAFFMLFSFFCGFGLSRLHSYSHFSKLMRFSERSLFSQRYGVGQGWFPGVLHQITCEYSGGTGTITTVYYEYFDTDDGTSLWCYFYFGTHFVPSVWLFRCLD